MENIFNYINKYGDFTLKELPFCNVDAFVLSCVSYCFFDDVLKPYSTQPVSIEKIAKSMVELYGFYELKEEVEIGEKFSKCQCKKIKFRDRRDIRLFILLGKSKRFKNMKLCCYVNHIHNKKQAQFSAISIMINSKNIFVSFRGTDRSLVGWKEDMNMTYCDFVPAHLGACGYLVYISQHFNSNILVGGHSKGGNLAVFSSVVAPEKVKGKIKAVYNFDGPGFHSSIIKFKGYRKILPIINSFIPEASVIGMMLAKGEKYKVIKSYEKGLFQHDPYTWIIKGRNFIYLDEVCKGSKFFDKTLKNWLKVLPKNKRETFFNAFFQILCETHSDNKGNLVISSANLLRILSIFPFENYETKKAILEGVYLYGIAVCMAVKDDFKLRKFMENNYEYRRNKL